MSESADGLMLPCTRQNAGRLGMGCVAPGGVKVPETSSTVMVAPLSASFETAWHLESSAAAMPAASRNTAAVLITDFFLSENCAGRKLEIQASLEIEASLDARLWELGRDKHIDVLADLVELPLQWNGRPARRHAD